jgi:hypothetical protein
MARILSLPASIILLILLTAPPAAAHRSDEFLSRREGPASTVVVVHRAYRVVWNGFEAPPGAPYHPQRRELTLIEVQRPVRNLEVQIPNVAPGRYALLAYDGSEGGEHITWTVFRVLPKSLPRTGMNGSEVSASTLAVFLLVAELALLSTSPNRPSPPSGAR